jgi:HTH-type transcriptional regulator, competence development regulator
MRYASTEDRAFLRELGRRVRLNRRYRAMTQAELAERANLSRSFVVEFEAGRHGIDVVSLRRLAKALGAPLPALVDIGLDDQAATPPFRAGLARTDDEGGAWNPR